MSLLLRAAAIAAACCLAAASVAADGLEGEGRLSASLSESGMELLTNLDAHGGAAFALSLAADDEGAALSGGFTLGGAGADGTASEKRPAPFLAAGPGRAAGGLCFLHDPLSSSALRLDEAPVALDPSLRSGTEVLGAGAAFFGAESARLSCFALAQRDEAGLLLRRGLERGAVSPRWAAAGLELAGQRARSVKTPMTAAYGRWTAAAAVSLRRGSSGGGGWEPDPLPDLAGLVCSGGIVGESRDAGGRSLAALGASLGAREGPGLAARIEAEERARKLALRASAAFAGPGFRTLSGSPVERQLALACDARLALRRAADIDLALRLDSPRAVAGERPLVGSSARLAADLPLATGRRILSPRLEVSRKPGGVTACALGLALEGGRRSGGDLGLSFVLVGEDGSFGGLGAEYRARAGAFGLEWELDLALSCLERGELAAPVGCEASFGLSAGLGEASKEKLRLEASSPEGGFVLAPLAFGARAPRFELELRYQASF